MHHIQRKILGKLLYAANLAYAQLRPEGIESNHFAYHLDQLVEGGLIIKAKRRYSLTTAGLILVDRLSQEKMVERRQPNIVTAIALTNLRGDLLLFKRAYQPFIHRYGLPSGKIHDQETIMEAAERELLEKTGLSGITLKHRGIIYLESKLGDSTLSKVMYHLFEGQTSNVSPLPPPTHRGVCMWVDLAGLKDRELMPGLRRFVSLLQSEPNFFFTEVAEGVAEKT